MKTVDPAVRRETVYIALFTLTLSALMQAVFLIAGLWELTVLFGNLLGAAAAILNFFLMGLTVQAAVKKEQKDAKNMMRASQSLRLLLLFAAAAVGVLVPCFHTVASLLPLFFPRMAILLHPLITKRTRS